MTKDTDLLSKFRFTVQLGGAGGGQGGAAFSEVSGLEISFESIELQEGGYNQGVRRLVGKVSSPPLVLKRGISTDDGFWSWAQQCLGTRYPLPYVNGTITQYSAADPNKKATWEFLRGIATQIKASDLSATSSEVPIEELHIVHEGLKRT